MNIKVAVTAIVADNAEIGQGTSVWHFAQVREGARIGQNCVISKSAYIDANVVLGENVKVQNNAQIFSPAIIEDGAFIGPGVILTNDKAPRAITESGTLKSETDWSKTGVTVLRGASIGAGAICVAPVTLGQWCMIGAGSVVTHDTLPFGLYVGSPAKWISWIGKAGVALTLISENRYRCPVSGSIYKEISGLLSEDDISEEHPNS